MNVAADSCFIEPGQEMPDRFCSASTWERADTQWPSHEQRTLTCTRVSAETHDVRTFVFSARDGRLFSFEPGQFITVSAEIAGKEISRCYTISSPPTRPHTLSITVKRTAGGVVSNWLHENMREGVELKVFGPSGVFTPSSGPAAKSLYLSAGSGVTPLMSMTRAALDLGLNRDIVFIHSARTPEDIIFRNELACLCALSDKLRVVHVCEAPGNEPDWPGPVGRLSLELLNRHVPDYRDREVFICGPGGYMDASRKMLEEGGHDPIPDIIRKASTSRKLWSAPKGRARSPAQNRADGLATRCSSRARVARSRWTGPRPCSSPRARPVCPCRRHAARASAGPARRKCSKAQWT
ncbi:ferredoxin-NADP reductase [Paraburkholderia atlantica]